MTSRNCFHAGEPVSVGPYEVLATGTSYLYSDQLPMADLVVPLEQNHQYDFSKTQCVYDLFMQDFGGVPDDWQDRLEKTIIPSLEQGMTILTFCIGSHGRTGTFLGSLIALLETPEQTPDPIVAVRLRHCERAVETRAQAKAIFDLRGEELPERYHNMR